MGVRLLLTADSALTTSHHATYSRASRRSSYVLMATAQYITKILIGWTVLSDKDQITQMGQYMEKKKLQINPENSSTIQ